MLPWHTFRSGPELDAAIKAAGPYFKDDLHEWIMRHPMVQRWRHEGGEGNGFEYYSDHPWKAHGERLTRAGAMLTSPPRIVTAPVDLHDHEVQGIVQIVCRMIAAQTYVWDFPIYQMATRPVVSNHQRPQRVRLPYVKIRSL